MFELGRFKISYRQMLIALVFIALVLRIFYLFSLPNELILPDAEDYWSCSENIINCNGFSLQPVIDKLAHVPPAYPLFLAGLKVVGIKSLFFIRLCQILLSVSLIPIIYYIGVNIFSKRIMFLTILLYAFSPHMIYWTAIISTENLVVILFTLSFFIFFKGIVENKTKPQLLSILLLGFSALTRSVFIYALPIYLLGVIFQGEKRVKRVLLYMSIFALTLLPWTVRNYLLFEHFVPVTLGNGSMQVKVLINFSQDYQDVLNENDSFYQHHLSSYHHPEPPVEEYTSDIALQSLARQMMKAHPVTTARFFLWNFLRFWTPGATFYLPFYGEQIKYKLFIPSFIFSGLLFPFFALGLIWLYKLDRVILLFTLLMFIYFTAVHTYLAGMLRYRFPLEVLFYLCVSCGVVYIYEKLISSRKIIKG